MQIAGVTIRNYRSIGKEGVLLRPWKRTNILVGRNNSGKSNVIRAIKMITSILRKEEATDLSELDHHKRSRQARPHFDLYIRVEDSDPDPAKRIASLLDRDEIKFSISIDPPKTLKFDFWSGEETTDFGTGNELFSVLANHRWTSRVDPDTIKKAMHDRAEVAFSKFAAAIPRVHTVPEFRQIRPGQDYTFDGQNLVGLLAQYQNPELGQDQLRSRFDLIQDFVQQLLHLPDARLDVTRQEQQLVINNQGLRLPLSSFGTGTHELVIMLTAVLSNEGDLYCIEEPEIHMHPRLQREFVDFVTNRTKNLYLISSHSHVFVDAVNWLDQVQVFHIEATEGTSTGTPILTDDDAVQALNDIGVAPSDLLQSNCVIWVEGPSDRIYIQKWIELLAPDLVEGRDYTILYYAGKLLSHLEFERDKMPDEFISVLRINQRAVVVIDSDRQKPGGRLNQTKERVQRQVEGTGGICWITDGREIENLIPIGPVNRVMEAITGKPVTLELGKYDSFDEAFQKVLDKSAAKAPPYAANKVDYSRKFSEETTSGDLDPTLEVVLNDVISSIRQWNQLA